jgi:hypothetical protein
MMSHTSRVLRLFAVLIVVLFTATSCGRHEAKRAEPAPDSTLATSPRSSAGNSADTFEPAPPQPSGPQVGKRDSLINAIAPQLSDWVVMWRETLPGFLPDSLWSQGKDSWKFVGVREPDSGPVEDGAPSGDLAARILTLDSPGGRYSLCIDNYQYMTPDGDSLIVGGDPESQPSLTDNTTKASVNLAMCGTPCGFHWAKWLSPTSFALGSWSEADDYGHWMQGGLSIYSIRDSTRANYVTRIVPVNDYDRYFRAWNLWLLGRYREIMKARPGT